MNSTTFLSWTNTLNDFMRNLESDSKLKLFLGPLEDILLIKYKNELSGDIEQYFTNFYNKYENFKSFAAKIFLFLSKMLEDGSEKKGMYYCLPKFSY